MDNRVHSKQPMPRVELDLSEAAQIPRVVFGPPNPWLWLRQRRVHISLVIAAMLFAAFVSPTAYRYELSQGNLVRISCITEESSVLCQPG